MFATLEETVDPALVRRREARVVEVREIYALDARQKQRLTQIARDAEDDGDWQVAGCSSSAQWLAQVSNSDYRTAVRITRTGAALRSLPALDRALANGALTIDQVAAAVEFATPASDAKLARLAVGKQPSEISKVARTLEPPAVADDAELYRRRSLSMTWTRGGRELAISGRLPLEQGAAFQQAIWDTATAQRSDDTRDGIELDWAQSAADALTTLARSGPDTEGVRRSPTTLIVHVSDDAPPRIEERGPISPETAERLGCDARRLTIALRGQDLVHSRVGRCASYAQQRALHKRSGHCQYPGCTATRELEAHHLVAVEHGGRTEIENLILLCPRHHKHLHDQHIRSSGTGEEPAFSAPPAGPSPPAKRTTRRVVA